MGVLFERFDSFFYWLFQTSIQSAVIVMLVLLVQKIFRSRLSASWSFFLWTILLLRLALPWTPATSFSLFNLFPQSNDLVTVSVEEITVAESGENESAGWTDAGIMPRLNQGDQYETVLPPQTVQPASRFDFDKLIDLSYGVWFCAVLILLVHVLIANFSLWRSIKKRRQLTDKGVLDLLEDCKEQMSVQTIVGVVETDKIRTPALFGFIRPRLLLPIGLIDSVNREDLRHIFLHELAHLKRMDILFSWAMTFLNVIHWFNPFIWWAFHRIRVDRELACDELALCRLNNHKPQEYGNTIVKLLEKYSQSQVLPGITGILENKSQLRRRIKMIVKYKQKSLRFSVLALVLIIAFGAVTLTNAKTLPARRTKASPTLLAQKFLNDLVQEKYSQACKNFSSELSKAFPEDKLKATWQDLLTKAGPFQKRLGTRTEKFLASDIVLITCQFKNGPLDIKAVYDQDKKMSGLWFVPTPKSVLEGYKKSASRPVARAAGAAPIVLETSPVAYSKNVKPGLKIITVTFDRPMMDRSWSWCGGGETFPELTKRPWYDKARKTCSISAKLKPGKVYWLGVNSPSNKNFKTAQRVPAVRYVILFATADKNGNATAIPQDMLKRAKRINSYTEKIRGGNGMLRKKNGKNVSGKMAILSRDDGESSGMKSIAGSAHSVLFDSPSENARLVGVRIYGSRYGTRRAPAENFHVYLCDKDQKIIKDFKFPYSRFQRGQPKWVNLPVKPIELPETFYLCASFNPHRTKGVYVHHDKETSDYSFTGLPENGFSPCDGGDWMIRAMVKK